MCNDIRIFKNLLKSLLKAIYYLTKLKIVHADLKSENILVEYDSSIKQITDVKLIDFGTS